MLLFVASYYGLVPAQNSVLKYSVYEYHKEVYIIDCVRYFIFQQISFKICKRFNKGWNALKNKYCCNIL